MFNVIGGFIFYFFLDKSLCRWPTLCPRVGLGLVLGSNVEIIGFERHGGGPILSGHTCVFRLSVSTQVINGSSWGLAYTRLRVNFNLSWTRLDANPIMKIKFFWFFMPLTVSFIFYMSKKNKLIFIGRKNFNFLWEVRNAEFLFLTKRKHFSLTQWCNINLIEVGIGQVTSIPRDKKEEKEKKKK